MLSSLKLFRIHKILGFRQFLAPGIVCVTIVMGVLMQLLTLGHVVSIPLHICSLYIIHVHMCIYKYMKVYIRCNYYCVVDETMDC